MVRIILIVIGIISLAVGVVGIILPVLPTTPFLLLASFCFLRSSTRLNTWFENSKMYTKYVVPVKEGHGLTLRAKLSILIFVYISLGLVYFNTQSWHLKITIIILVTVKTVFFAKMKTRSNHDQ